MATEARSVVDVEVKDAQFKAFLENVEKYKKTLTAMPGAWGAIGTSIQKASKAGNDFAVKVAGVAKAMSEAKTNTEKFTIGLKAADRTVTSLVRSTSTMAVNIKDATTSLLKWGSMISGFAGLLAGGGLFGISRLAQAVSGQQAGSWLTGSSIGTLKAYGSVYSQSLGQGGAESVLADIYKLQQDVAGRGGLQVMLGNQYDVKNASPAQIFQDLITSIRQKNELPGFKGNAMNNPWLNNPQFNPFSMDQTLMMLSKNKQGNYNFNAGGLREQANAAIPGQEISQQGATAWAGFERRLDLTMGRLESVFSRALIPLLPPLERFGVKFASAIDTLTRNGTFEKWTKEAGQLLDKFSNTISDNGNIDDFMKGLDVASGALIAFGELIGHLIPGKTNVLTGSQYGVLEGLRKSGMSEKQVQAIREDWENPGTYNDWRAKSVMESFAQKNSQYLGASGKINGQPYTNPNNSKLNALDKAISITNQIHVGVSVDGGAPQMSNWANQGASQ